MAVSHGFTQLYLPHRALVGLLWDYSIIWIFSHQQGFPYSFYRLYGRRWGIGIHIYGELYIWVSRGWQICCLLLSNFLVGFHLSTIKRDSPCWYSRHLVKNCLSTTKKSRHSDLMLSEQNKYYVSSIKQNSGIKSIVFKLQTLKTQVSPRNHWGVHKTQTLWLYKIFKFNQPVFSNPNWTLQ